MWRRLRRIGALALNNVQILPDREECIEAFKWLAQEVQQAKGEALIMCVEHFEELADQDLIERFRESRREEYTEIDTQATEIEKALETITEPSDSPIDRCISIGITGLRCQ
ncbi:Chromate resistance protein ChrB [Leptothoe sp. PORK10 BA2]|uniref:Chromate resistance protein ChrB n=1 Tax=Leptothoe sp. PORK10 BA2 TaxID=3110254 RepID=UPI002B209D5A|nr:Chromate resistance protein ChrB [Leptothoe sp. PORK10 BA2]MEA5464836.1 Chromate resistance protein ChrB [Leptothoe sp. PORK10 BA2]